MILRSALLFLSRRRGLRRWVEESPLAGRWTRRFVAGRTLEEGLEVVARLNAEEISATLDHLGENVASVEEGARTRDAYLAALRQIAARQLDSTVSIKLTHFGLDFSEAACQRYVTSVVAEAHRLGNSVEVDMETHENVDRTLAVVRAAHASHGNVRAVVQAYLRRSEEDVLSLCRQGIPVRLCKGAYEESAAVAFTERTEVDANYLRLARILIEEGVCPAMATHDERIILEVVRLARASRQPPECLEFQMLYGIRTSLQRQLASDGFRVRLYVPYGVAWYPYFMRRLAERPANLLLLMRNLTQR